LRAALGEDRTVTIIFDGGPLAGQTRSVTTSGGLPLAPTVVPVQPGTAWRQQPVYFPTRERDVEGRYVYRLSDIEGNPSWLRNLTVDAPWPMVAADQSTAALRAWWTYWLTIGIAVVAWVTAALLAPDGDVRAALANPVVLVVLLAPLVAAGLNLVLFRNAHEEACRLEVQRHRWMRAIAGGGYSARSFALTGVAILALVAWIVGTRIL
jgi:hypothetical protein